MTKKDINKLQKKMLKRMDKRKNRNNWAGFEGYTIKKSLGFKMAHGKYIRGE